VLSAVRFPDHQGKYREFERSNPDFDRLRDEKCRRCLGFLGKFPTQRNREFLSGNRELFLRIREFSGLIRENSNSPHTLLMKYAVGVRCIQEKRASDRRALTGQGAGRRLAYVWADTHLGSNRIIC